MSYRRWAKNFRLDPNGNICNFLSFAAAGFFLYTIIRGGVRFFDWSLPGQCYNIIISFSQVGECIAPMGLLGTRIAGFESGHSWSWVLVGCVGLFACLYPRYHGVEGKKWGGVDGGRGMALAVFLVAVHELIWYVFYFLYHNNKYLIGNLTYYSPFISFLFVALLIFFAVGFYKDLDWRVFLIGLVFYLVMMVGWGEAGFPITLDLKLGMTSLYADPTTDFIEFVSWYSFAMLILCSYVAKAGKEK